MNKQLKDIIAIILIGDGVVGALNPKRHSLLWKFGPRPYQKVMEAFIQRPGLTRLLAVLEIGVGIWLAPETEDVVA